MNNLFIEDPIYITIQDLKDSTNKTWIASLTDNQIKRLIYEAQFAIDDYILHYWTKYSESQSFIFPTQDEDWNIEVIPNDIKIATVYVCEQIFESWDTVSSTYWEVTEEVAGDRRIKYTSWTRNVLKTIPDKAKIYLEPYRNIFYRQKT